MLQHINFSSLQPDYLPSIIIQNLDNTSNQEWILYMTYSEYGIIPQYHLPEKLIK